MVKPAGQSNFTWTPFDGPYTIIGIHKPDIYKLRQSEWPPDDFICVHANRLKPYCRLEPRIAFQQLETNEENLNCRDPITTQDDTRDSPDDAVDSQRPVALQNTTRDTSCDKTTRRGKEMAEKNAPLRKQPHRTVRGHQQN